MLALLALRRFRHLILALIVAQLLTMISENVVGPDARRPRPFGVSHRGRLGRLGPALAAGDGPGRHPGGDPVHAGARRAAGGSGASWWRPGWWRWPGWHGSRWGPRPRPTCWSGRPSGSPSRSPCSACSPPTRSSRSRYRRGRAAHLDVTGPRGAAIRRGLEDQLGLAVTEVTPFGLAGSAGSTPLRITVKGDPPSHLFGKLYARSHLRADRWYKLGRELLYGRLEDEKPFNTVRRLVQQEDYALRLCRDAGLPTPRPYGVVELTPEREYLLVTEFFAGAVELGEAEVDEQVIDDGLGSSASCGRPGWPTATSSRPTCWSATAGCC